MLHSTQKLFGGCLGGREAHSGELDALEQIGEGLLHGVERETSLRGVVPHNDVLVGEVVGVDGARGEAPHLADDGLAKVLLLDRHPLELV